MSLGSAPSLDNKRAPRFVVRLDLKGSRLVKGMRLQGWKALGPASSFAEYYSDRHVDELLLIDTVASLYGREYDPECVKEIAMRTDLPLAIGGGVSSLRSAEDLMLAGADKVVVNSGAIENPPLIDALANFVGSSNTVVSIQASRDDSGNYWATYWSGRENSGRKVLDWAREAVDRGAGEIILTSAERDGTGEGFDFELAQEVTEEVSVPVVVSGGAGTLGDVRRVARFCDAFAIGSMLHFGITSEATAENQEQSHTVAMLEEAGRPGRVLPCTPEQVRASVHQGLR